MLVVTFFMDVSYGRVMRFHKTNYTYMLTPEDVRDEMGGGLCLPPPKILICNQANFSFEFHTQQEPF